jgi:hypothetical protein
MVIGIQSRYIVQKLLNPFPHVFRPAEREAVSPRAQEVTEAIFSHMFRSSEREAVSPRAQEVTESIFSHMF